MSGIVPIQKSLEGEIGKFRITYAQPEGESPRQRLEFLLEEVEANYGTRIKEELPYYSVGGLVTLAGIGMAVVSGQLFILVYPAVLVGLGFLLHHYMEYFHSYFRLSLEGQKQKADELGQKKFIMADGISEMGLLPVFAEACDYILNGNRKLYAVKLYEPEISKTSISDLTGQHAGLPIIISGYLTSVPGAEDMKIGADVNLHMSGAMIGIPFSGSAYGRIEGDVYSPTIQLRLSDGKKSVFVNIDSMDEIPYILTHINPGFGTSFASRNELVHFLREAQEQGTKVSLLGRVDNAGIFHGEAIRNPDTEEIYYLSIYQPKALPAEAR